MKTNGFNELAVADSLDSLRAQIVALGDRVAAIERSFAARVDAAATSSASPTFNGAGDMHDQLSPEIIAVISAALAAYLGVKARIRQISLVGGESWAHQGRMTIQASHALTIQRE